MTKIIRYYQVSSNTLPEISQLEKNILRHFLPEQSRDLTSPERREISGKSNIHLEILYNEIEVVAEPKKKIFGKDVIGAYSKELVLEIDEEQVGFLDRYLATTNLDIAQMRTVNLASIPFASIPSDPQTAKNYGEMLQKFITEKYSGVKVETKIVEKITWEGKSGDYCSGLISGPIKEVIGLYHFIQEYETGSHIKKLNIALLTNGEQASLERPFLLMPKE